MIPITIPEKSGKDLHFVSESFQMEAKSITVFKEITVVKFCKSFYQANKHYIALLHWYILERQDFSFSVKKNSI